MEYYHYKAMTYNLYGGENLMSMADNAICEFLDKYGIRVVLNLAGNRYQIRHNIRIEYIDIEGIPPKDRIDKCIKIIKNAINADKPVLVHCDRGTDRTGCVIGSYLCFNGKPFAEVKAFLINCFPQYRRSKKYIDFYEPYFNIIRSYENVSIGI